MRIAIIGATGFIGQALIRRLLADMQHQIVAFSKSAGNLSIESPRLTKRSGDLFDQPALAAALQECDAAVYLVHMMGASHDYAELEARGAHVFANAAKATRLKRVVFLGGLGDEREELSKHLSSRQRTGQILRDELPLVIELRASLVIGNGSVGYEIIKAIARKLPVLAIPHWTVTPSQPIALDDVLSYIVAAIERPLTDSQVVDIGGPEVMTYPQILERYTAWAGHKQHVFKVPLVPRWAASWWLNRYMSAKNRGIGKPMVESLHHAMVVRNDNAKTLFPAIKPQPIEQAFVD